MHLYIYITHHEDVIEPWMPYVVPNGRDVQREYVILREDAYPGRWHFMVGSPFPSRVRGGDAEDSYGRDDTSTTEIHMRGLEDIERMLEIVV